VAPQQRDVALHQPLAAHAASAYAEVAMPEKSHLFQQRMGRKDHPPQPPRAQRLERVRVGVDRVGLPLVVGAVEGRHVGLGVQQAVDGSLWPVAQRLLQRGPVGPKPGPAKQVCGPAQIPRLPRVGRIGRPRLC